jgi:hypothetical protein
MRSDNALLSAFSELERAEARVGDARKSLRSATVRDDTVTLRRPPRSAPLVWLIKFVDLTVGGW